MKVQYLAKEKTIHFTLPGRHVYVIDNPEGRFEFSLDAADTELLVLCLRRLTGNDEKKLEIIQHHTAPRTRSEVLIKVALEGTARFDYRGMIHIEKNAETSVSSQEARGLLLSKGARFEAIPSLEILPEDVQCHHKTTAAPLDREAIFTLQTRGVPQKEAEILLKQAFLRSGLERLKSFDVTEDEIQTIAEKIV